MTSRLLDRMARTVAAVIMVLAIIVAFRPGGIARRTVSDWRQEAELRKIVDNEWNELAGTGPTLGAPQGDVVTVMFVDYLCGYCRMVHDTIVAFLAASPGVAVSVRQLPNPGSRLSRAASSFALCGYEQGRFELVHGELLSNDDAVGGEMSLEDWAEVARRLGLPGDAVLECMESESTNSVLTRDAALAARLSLRSTPAFLTVGAGLRRGVRSRGEMAEWAEDARDR